MAHGGRGIPHCLIWPKRVSAAKQGMDFRVVSFQLDRKPLKEREGWRREVNICGTSTGLSRLLEPRSLRGRAGQPTLAYNIMTHTGGKSPRGEVVPYIGCIGICRAKSFFFSRFGLNRPFWSETGPMVCAF